MVRLNPRSSSLNVWGCSLKGTHHRSRSHAGGYYELASGMSI